MLLFKCDFCKATYEAHFTKKGILYNGGHVLSELSPCTRCQNGERRIMTIKRGNKEISLEEV